MDHNQKANIILEKVDNLAKSLADKIIELDLDKRDTKKHISLVTSMVRTSTEALLFDKYHNRQVMFTSKEVVESLMRKMNRKIEVYKFKKENNLL
jgi:hypothetical protein